MILHQHHLDHLRTSGLADDTIAAAGFYSVDDASEAGRLLGWDGDGPAPALAIPYFDRSAGVTMTILRPDHPRERDGKVVKYESPLNVSPRLYFVPAAITSPARYTSAAEPVFLVEGIKKALKLAEQGAIAISAQGTTVWHSITTKRSEKHWQLHEDFESVPLADRVTFITFDGGDTTSNVAVILAEARLARMCMDEGGRTWLIRVPSNGDKKMGIDDYLASVPDPLIALQHLCRHAVPADPLARARALRDATDIAVEAQHLLRDLAFAAALDVGGQAVIDIVAQELSQAAKITKTAVNEAIDTFKARLRAKSSKSPATGGAVLSPPSTGPGAASPVRGEAISLLKGDAPLSALIEILVDDGLVGEREAAATLALVMVSRKSDDPLHAAVKGASSAGKSQVVKRVVGLFPPEDVIDVTSMTPQALMYLPADLDGKVVTIAEQEGAERAQYSMRVAMSERTLHLWVPEKQRKEGDDGQGRIETVRRDISCSSSFITTTTRPRLFEDNETRVIEILLDESKEQTERVNEAQIRRAIQPPTQWAKLAINHRKEVAREAMRLVPGDDVVIPDAASLRKVINPARIRARRDLPKIIGLIKAHARLNFMRRERQGDMIVATAEDIEAAVRLSRGISRGGSNLLATYRDKLEAAYGLMDFSAAQATPVLGFADPSTTLEKLKKMLDEDMVEVVAAHHGQNPGRWRVVGSPVTITPTVAVVPPPIGAGSRGSTP